VVHAAIACCLVSLLVVAGLVAWVSSGPSPGHSQAEVACNEWKGWVFSSGSSRAPLASAVRHAEVAAREDSKYAQLLADLQWDLVHPTAIAHDPAQDECPDLLNANQH
jgi:hypothetical protein